MQVGRERHIILSNIDEILKNKTLTTDEKFKFQYFQAYFMRFSNHQDYLNRLQEGEKLKISLLSHREKSALFRKMYNAVKQRQRVIFARKKGFYRKVDFHEKWVICYLQCDENYLYLYREESGGETYKQMGIQHIWVSKRSKKIEELHGFRVVYDKKKYEIGFQAEFFCEKLHQKLVALVLQTSQMSSDKKLSQLNADEGLKKNEDVLVKSLIHWQQDATKSESFRVETIHSIIDEENFIKMQALVSEFKVLSAKNYSLIKNIPNGKISYCKESNKLKLSLLISQVSIDELVQSYLQFENWNSFVEQFKIINQLEGNTYLTHLKLKRFNFLTSPRQAFLNITYYEDQNSETEIISNVNDNEEAYKLRNKTYIFIRTSENSLSSGHSASMKMNQSIQFSDLGDRTIFMTIISDLDYNSFSYLASNLDVSLAFFNDIEFLNNLCNENQISKKKNQLFQHLPNPSNELLTFKTENRSKSLNKRNTITTNTREEQEIEDDTLKIIFDFHKNIKNEGMIKLIQQRTFEKYYLRHRFREVPFQKSSSSLQVKDFLFRNGRWKIKNENLVFSDEDCLQEQKGLIKKLIKKIGSNIMSGKSIMNVSLPVQIFHTHSALEAYANGLGFLPQFIKNAIATQDIVQQIKHVTMCFLFKFACNSHILKPFNPILGETFSCIIGGIPVYFEQISHHPPIASFYIKTKDFQSYGNYDLVIEVGLNVAYFKFHSLMCVKLFNSDSEFIIKVPNLEVGGVMLGDRSIKLIGKGFVLEKKNQILCEISVGKDNKHLYPEDSKLGETDLAGGIFKITTQAVQRLLSLDKCKSYEGINREEMVQKYSKISGKWYGDMSFDHVQYKSVKEGPFPLEIERPAFLLPSDSLFRADIVYKKWGDNDTSNRQKEILQDLQRHDKKLRQKHKK